jgi:hypothetical protein
MVDEFIREMSTEKREVDIQVIKQKKGGRRTLIELTFGAKISGAEKAIFRISVFLSFRRKLGDDKKGRLLPPSYPRKMEKKKENVCC